MPTLKKIIYNHRTLIVKNYNNSDLIQDSFEFSDNRKFNTWRDYFYKKLYKIRKHHEHWKLSYDKLARKIPPKVVEIFLAMLTDDLLHDHEFIVNPRASLRNQFRFKVSHIIKPKQRTYRWRLFVKKNSKFYYLQIHRPRTWNKRYIRKHISFTPHYRGKLNAELKKGRLYYNSHKEKLFAQL